MDKELKAKWIEALRSRKYKQGRNYLRSLDDKYCCLGVLCAIQDAPFEKDEDDLFAYVINEDDRLPYSGKPPERFRGGMPYHNIMTLIDMNDRFKVNFKKIADWIEENL